MRSLPTYNVDTRDYNQLDFVQGLLSDVCGQQLEKIEAFDYYETIKYIDAAVSITDYDGKVLSADDWRPEIERELNNR